MQVFGKDVRCNTSNCFLCMHYVKKSSNVCRLDCLKMDQVIVISGWKYISKNVVYFLIKVYFRCFQSFYKETPASMLIYVHTHNNVVHIFIRLFTFRLSSIKKQASCPNNCRVGIHINWNSETINEPIFTTYNNIKLFKIFIQPYQTLVWLSL